jgi:hypothetical protein
MQSQWQRKSCSRVKSRFFNRDTILASCVVSAQSQLTIYPHFEGSSFIIACLLCLVFSVCSFPRGEGTVASTSTAA